MAPLGRIAGWSSVVLALIGLTLGLYEFVPRYEPSGRQLLEDHDFRQDLAAWWTKGRVHPDPARLGTVVLEVAGPAPGSSVISQSADLRTPATVIVRAEIAAQIVDPGDGRVGMAWIIIGNLAGSAPASLYWEEGASQPYLAKRSHGWWPLQATLTIPGGEGRLTVEAGVGGGAGSVLRIADLAVLEASERPAFRIGRLALMAAWGLTAIWGGAAMWRGFGRGRARQASAVLVGGGALALMLPEAWRQQLSLLLGGAPEATGHALLFFLLALSCRWGRPQDPFWRLFAILALVAAASEVVQSFVPGRGSDLHDWLADLAGIVAGLALVDPALRFYGRVIGRNRAR